MHLPEPMLAKPGPLPAGRGWSFEPNWDGFRAIVHSGENYTIRSRRGWLMTELLPEFASIPVEGVFDGELVAFGADGLPSFGLLSRRILHGDKSIPVAGLGKSIGKTPLPPRALRHLWATRIGPEYAQSPPVSPYAPASGSGSWGSNPCPAAS
jgi:hypothetical protein